MDNFQGFLKYLIQKSPKSWLENPLVVKILYQNPSTNLCRLWELNGIKINAKMCPYDAVILKTNIIVILYGHIIPLPF